MNSSTAIVNKAEHYITGILQNQLPSTIIFHTYHHTREVAEATLKIGIHSKLSAHHMEIVLLAAWFHDVGYCFTYINHEDESKRIAHEFLVSQNYLEDNIQKVLSCIEATRYPQHPHNKWEEVLCDADLYHLSMPDYLEKEKLLRKEWEKALGKVWSNKNWRIYNLQFITKHQYFTVYGRKYLSKGKRQNIDIIESQLRAK